MIEHQGILSFDNIFLRNKVLSMVLESESLNERVTGELGKIAASQTGFYSQMLEMFTRVRHSEDVAARHWMAIVEYHDTLLASRGSKADPRATVLNYFINLQPGKDSGFQVSPHMGQFKERIPLIDDITGAFNRKYLAIALKKEIKRAQRYGKQFSLVLFAPDRVADTGANAREAAQLMKRFSVEMNAGIRAEDTLCRYDEHRFCVVLPETRDDGAIQFVRRMQAVFVRTPFFMERDITFSAGVASYPASGKTPDDLLGFMENSLAAACAKGKNTVGKLLRDRRRFQRFIMTWKMEYQEQASAFGLGPAVRESHSADVSLGGLRVELNRELDPGSRVTLALHPALLRRKTIALDGVVRWKSKMMPSVYAHGIEFANLQPTDSRLLEQALPLHRVRV
jgi:diguanylate cyclase (GGDEF)-like protein